MQRELLVDGRRVVAERLEHHEGEADHHEVHADVERERGGDLHRAEQRHVVLPVVALEHRPAEQQRRERGDAGDHDAGAEHEPRLAARQPAHLDDAAADVPQRDRGAGDDAAGEAAAGLVVAGEQQVERADHHDREHHAHRHLERHQPRDVHRRRDRGDCAGGGGALGATPARASATVPIAAIASTVISPSVSKPRKSTRITFTTFLPPPSGTDALDVRVGSDRRRVLGTGDERQDEHHRAHRGGDGEPQRLAPQRCARLEAVGQTAQHEHEQHRGERLDAHLRERQVGRAVQHEQPGHRVADHAEEQRRSEAAVHDRRRERGADDDRCGRDLDPVVVRARATRLHASPVSSRAPGITAAVSVITARYTGSEPDCTTADVRFATEFSPRSAPR